MVILYNQLIKVYTSKHNRFKLKIKIKQKTVKIIMMIIYTVCWNIR